MRIIYFADIRFPLERANGIQTMETCHAMARRGHHVELIVRRDTRTPARDPFEYYGLPAVAGLQIERVPVTGPMAARRLGYMAFAAGRAAGAARADVVMTRDLGVASLLLRIPGALRPPVVYESHGYAPDVAAALPGLIPDAPVPDARKLRRLARREARVWQEAEGYVTITTALHAELEARHGGRGHVVVVPDGVRLERAAEQAAVREMRRDSGARPVVAYAGHLYAWKGVDVLLDALALLPEADGLIVGGHESEPDLARLKAQAARAGMAGRIRFTGLVPPADVPALLRQATILALPNPASAISTHFTSPLKLFEYMAAGRPIVASDLPSIREVLHDGENAVLVAPANAAALADGVRRLLRDPAEAARLAGAALAQVPDYSWARRAERLEDLFEAL